MPILPFMIGASMISTPVAPVQTAAPVAVASRYAPPAAPRYPALWVVNDKDTIIYLFGTFHALDGRSEWFGQAVKTAFSASDQLILETLVPRPAVSQPVASGEFSLRGVDDSAAPGSRLGPSSYLGNSKTVMNAGRSKGLSTAHGADAVLRDAADASGKPVGGLESFAFQMRMISTLPASPEAVAQATDPRAMSALAALLTHLQAAWSRGDLDSFAPMMMQMRAESPQMYRTLFIERNSRWAHWIAQRLDTPGTVFVAVGAGHLSGPDSVQNQLASLGVKSARVN